MNDAYWEEFAKNADANYNEEFAKFIRDLTVSLRCQSVLEVGCNAGNDLKLFGEGIKVHGIDSNQKIIDIARSKNTTFDFKIGEATALPYEDTSIDMIFTHGFMNYLEDDKVNKTMQEMFRITRRYVVNCEMLGDDNIIDEKTGRKGRNMYKRWLDYKVKIISNVEMHEDIDSEKPKFLLVRKL